MAVAKSYQNLEIVKEPYTVNGKMYVQVKMANGNAKQVRWYSDREYAKYYGEPVDHSNDPYYRTQREVLGFVNGFITIFKGDTYPLKDWFKENGARYTKLWGWGFASDKELPEIPEGIEAVRLDWSAVGADEETLKNDDAVKAAVEALTLDPSNSQFQGQVGERLEIDVTIKKAFLINGMYGASMCYTMVDADDNEFVWITTSTRTQLKEGETCTIRGTVKAHKVYRNVPQTTLTRCTKVGGKK